MIVKTEDNYFSYKTLVHTLEDLVLFYLVLDSM